MAVYGVRVGVIMASRCSADAVSSCCKTAASFGCRHVHFARCIQTVPAPHRLHAQPQQGRTQWRCYASKVKDMPEKQLKGKQEAAEAGADDPAPNDHYDKVLEQLEKDSRDRMDKAVSNAREAMAKMTVRGPSHDEHESDERQLKKTSEEGKIAVRNVRRQVMQKIGRLARDGDISQDDQDRMTDFIQELTDDHVDTIEESIKRKRTKI